MGFSATPVTDAGLLLTALPDPVLRLDRSGGATLNAAARRRLGQLSPDHTWLDLFSGEGPERLRAAVARAWQGEAWRESAHLTQLAGLGAADLGAADLGTGLGAADLGVAPRSADGNAETTPLTALVTVVPGALAEDGQPGAVWVHLQVQPDPLQTALRLLDDLGLGLTVQAADSRILHANSAAQQILGLSLDQLQGRDSLDPRWRAIHPSGRAFPGETHPAPVALQTGQTQRDVPMGVFHPQTESWRWLNITAVPETAPGETRPHQVLAVFADVTERQRLQTELRYEERRYRSLVEATTQIVWDALPDGDFQPPQPGWQAFTGQTPDEFRGTGWLDAIHPEDRAHTLADWQGAVERQDLYQTEHRLRRADGQYVPMQVRAAPVRGDDGEVRAWTGAHMDISLLKAAEATLRDQNTELARRVEARTRELTEVTQLSTLLLDSAGEGIFGVDPQGRVIFANPEAARLVGYQQAAMIGQDKHALIHSRQADGTPYPRDENPVIRTLRDGQTRRVESDVLWHAAGHAVPVSLMVTPVRGEGGEVTGAVVLAQNITERLRARQELENVIAELRRSNADLEQFAYVASHDLQEPLRTLGSYTQLLARRYQGQLDPRADQYLEFIGAAVERMRSLIQDLLGFARIHRQEAAPEALALDPLVGQAAELLRGTLDDTGAELSWQTPHRVLAYPGLTTQLLVNLLSNALKFVPPGTRPQVEVRSQRAGQHVQVSVQDNGIGIAPEYHERVFDIFQRLHRRETYAGNGMGLAICRRIVEHSGGRLWLDSSPGQGSTFHFTLPAAPTDDDSPEPCPASD